jgi:maltose alpha-D-glucosyltransferase/alpha-amylase
MLKLFRRLEVGENPDVEINHFLWSHGYRHVPEPLGSMNYESEAMVSTLGIAQRFVPSRGTAWDVTLELLQRSFEHAAEHSPQIDPLLPSADWLDSSRETPPASIAALLGPYAPLARLLGQRTAELHLALASSEIVPTFRPEPFDHDYQRALVEAARARVTQTYDLLAKQRHTLPESLQPRAREVLECREGLSRKLDAAADARVHASRIRCHGDYHLGQVLYDGNDFIILDFEGEPAQPIAARRLKRSALYDVCGMVRSFHYAATVALQDARLNISRELLGRWSDAWYHWTSALFLGAYFSRARETSQPAVFLPQTDDELRAILPVHMIDKCSYELGYELNNRPAWVAVPLAGLLSLSKSR